MEIKKKKKMANEYMTPLMDPRTLLPFEHDANLIL